MNQGPIRAILFDLGGVLVGLRGLDHFAMQPPLGGRWTEAELRRFFQNDSGMARYETGEWGTVQYLSHLRSSLQIEASDPQLSSIINEILLGPHQQSEELLAELAGHTPLYLLSNTNALHWEVIKPYPILRHFTELFTSHLIGFRKPDERAYRHVLEQVSLLPHEMLFIDDLPNNVDAALAIGMHAFVCENLPQVREELARRGVIGG